MSQQGGVVGGTLSMHTSRHGYLQIEPFTTADHVARVGGAATDGGGWWMMMILVR